MSLPHEIITMSDSTIVNGVVSNDTNIKIEDDSGDGNDSKVATLMQKIAALEREKSELVHDNEVVKEAVNKGEIEELDAESEKLTSESKVLDSIAGRAAQLETEVSRLQHDLLESEVSKSASLEVMERERNLLLEKISKDSEGVKELTSRISDLEKKIQALEMRDCGYYTERIKDEEEFQEKIERDLKINKKIKLYTCCNPF